jgi:endonuclease/exonuclease/phosphatase family metal-dependent hydrolase
LTYTYHQFNAKYVDNFTEAGNGIGTSFNGKLPLLRIDYIFTDTSFQIYNFNVIKEDFSDHYPIASVIGI